MTDIPGSPEETKERARYDRRHGVIETEAPIAIEAGSGCILATESFEAVYAIGDKIAFRGRILYCAELGAWIDQGAADPSPGTGAGRSLVS